MKHTQFTVGDKVAYSVQFLRSTGMAHTPIAHARGIITELKPIGSRYDGMVLAVIDWGTDEFPPRVNVLRKSDQTADFAHAN